MATPPPAPPHADADELAFAQAVIRAESGALETLAGRLGDSFSRAVALLVACADSGGNVLVSGLGKSGLIGAKISATLASLGIPSHNVHPSEAFHGDLGRFRPSDTVICISFSGETDEVVNLASVLRQDGISIISITGGRIGNEGPSSLERLASVSLTLGVSDDGGHGYLAPTCSTTATLALGDALALAAARRRNFTHEDFQRRHPGGALGELLRPITEVLRWRVGKNLPLVHDDCTTEEALRMAAAAGRRPGALTLIDRQSGRLSGIFTDGDLRRLILRDPGELRRPVREIMTRSPRTLTDVDKVRDAVKMFREHRQDEIPVVDESGRPVGILDVQDLMAMRLVQD
ncbi:MAG: KpsF/GutQ family sugar-phosphate isomerase [Phycisphaerae bacterium]|nr:KpsF/GutQ family sugar-phosphate isomerase [Phycisphaerae bacterium]